MKKLLSLVRVALMIGCASAVLTGAVVAVAGLGVNRIAGSNVIGGDGLYLATNDPDTMHIRLSGDASMQFDNDTLELLAVGWGHMASAVQDTMQRLTYIESGETFSSAKRRCPLIFKEGSNVTLAFTDHGADSSVLTITASAGSAAGGSDTEIQYNNGSALDGIAGFIWDDTNIEVADDTDFAFGTDADWLIQYDEGVDDQLILITAQTAAIAVTDPLMEILVGSAVGATQEVFGIAKGTQVTNTEIFTVDGDGDVHVLGTLDGVDLAALNSAVETDSGNWNDAYGWDDHSGQNYLDNDDVNVDTADWSAAWDTVVVWDNRGYPDASTTEKGIASFSSTDFSVASGDVSILTAAIAVDWFQFALKDGLDDTISIYYPLADDSVFWYCKHKNTHATADDQLDTVVFSVVMPEGSPDIDSFTFDRRTSSSTTTTASLEVDIYKRGDALDATLTSIYDGSAASSSSYEWERIQLNDAALGAISGGDRLIAYFIILVDNGEYVDHSSPIAWYTGK